MSETVTAANGVELPVIALEQTFTYDGDLVATISVDYVAAPPSTAVVTYTQTFTNDGTNITGISQWIPS